ncbi:MAG: hypothetical protein M1147_09030 [Nitrospirae bacterium]|nr:hypothetical protein [Nitrospirota bacterium]
MTAFRFILERHPAFLRSYDSPLKHPCYAWSVEVASGNHPCRFLVGD